MNEISQNHDEKEPLNTHVPAEERQRPAQNKGQKPKKKRITDKSKNQNKNEYSKGISNYSFQFQSPIHNRRLQQGLF